MPEHDEVTLSTDESLMFRFIVDNMAYRDRELVLSDALRRVSYPQSYQAMDAWQRRAREMWRTAPGA